MQEDGLSSKGVVGLSSPVPSSKSSKKENFLRFLRAAEGASGNREDPEDVVCKHDVLSGCCCCKAEDEGTVAIEVEDTDDS